MTPTYLINLARSADRRAHMAREFAKAKVSYEIIEAVDGRDLDLSDPLFVNAQVNESLIPYSIGCALSHFKAYQKMLDDGADVALIMEDDTQLPADFNDLVKTAKQRMSGAEVILLCFQSYEAQLTKTGVERLPAGRELVQFVDKGCPRSTAAYLITRAACERMLKIMQPPIKTVADDWAAFYHEGAIDRVRAVLPMPVTVNPDLRTTRDNLRPGSLKALAVNAANNAKIPGVYHYLAHRRKRFLHELHGRLEFVADEPGNSLPLMTRSH